ncbi:hypothetical protein [Rhizobacter sp. P5_C2]
MKERLFTTLFWGYRPVTEEQVKGMSRVERVYVIDRMSDRDNLEYVPRESGTASGDKSGETPS